MYSRYMRRKTTRQSAELFQTTQFRVETATAVSRRSIHIALASKSDALCAALDNGQTLSLSYWQKQKWPQRTALTATPALSGVAVSFRNRRWHHIRTSMSTSTRPDPFRLVAEPLAQVRGALLDILGSSNQDINQIAKYYFLQPSKQLRPLIVLLFAKATNGLGHDWTTKLSAATTDLDQSLTRADVLSDFNPSMHTKTAPFTEEWTLTEPPHFPPSTPPLGLTATDILPTQRRLAQIVEMIHAASLLHDDVIDQSPLRRGAASAPEAYGTKLSVLGGNFILGRASAALARLGDSKVVELIASIMSNLVEGEILQMQEAPAPARAWRVYLQKTYMKTASLMAKGARGSVVLGGCQDGQVYGEVAYAYGRNLGIAFQLVDDILDYESGEATLGKPGGADLQLGLATGPALFAWEEYPEIGPLIERKFRQPGDVERARELVRHSAGVERTRELALAYANQAKVVLDPLPDSEAKSALIALTERVVKRTS